MQALPISQWTPLPWFLVSPPSLGAQIMARPRLCELFEQSVAKSPFTLVAAPSGFSKTTSLAAWSAHSSMAVAWLTLHGNNGGESVFLNGVVSALHRIIPTLGEEDAALLSGLLPDATDSIVTLERIVTASHALYRPVVVVIDNAHLAGEAIITRLFGILGMHCTEKLRFVLSGSPELVKWFNKDLIEGRATWIGHDSLALTEKELELEVSSRPETRDNQVTVDQLL